MSFANDPLRNLHYQRLRTTLIHDNKLYPVFNSKPVKLKRNLMTIKFVSTRAKKGVAVIFKVIISSNALYGDY